MEDLYIQIPTGSSSKSREDSFAKGREFIWTHWKSKHAGKLKLEQYTKEGEKMLTTYEIGSEESGNWFVRVESENIYISRRTSPNKTYQESQNRSCMSVRVERLDFTQNGLKEGQIISEELTRSAGSYRLRFLGSNGEECNLL